ncbi:hypothetical protein RJ640_022754 [Escallonia rubra]|uniref:Switch 2 n=1 Tax=Escallonia rubra TaxID=112253 RepID=A0AA88S5U7_9ASTE|nr:hypothetical protein RJ640_022754 [Escallonia rubra]
MSLHDFKETLKPCSKLSSASSTYTSISSYSQSSLLSLEFDSSIIPRKPPKSSLSQQLLRLEDTPSLPQTIPQSQNKQSHLDVANEDEDDNEDQERQDRFVFEKPRLDFAQFDQMGPFEPLVLSLPGESPVVQVPASINCRLLEHQRVGVKFLFNLYKNNHGGVLGDDMGLGKTIQTIAFLAAVYEKDGELSETTTEKWQVEKKGPVVIVCPSSVIHNWEIEFSKWAPFSVAIYHGVNRDLIMDKVEARAIEILITSFDTYRICGSILSKVQWEVAIIDEAHRLKNEKSKLYAACLEIKTAKRYGLTGTIMQNKIMELFNLFDWVAPGCLGTREHFRKFYDEPLKHGQRSTAPDTFVQVADVRKQHLVEVLGKYLLRRTKEETIGNLMMGKEDNVVFCAMSEVQKRVYQRMLQLPEIQCLVNKDLPCSCGSPLKQAECCKRTIPNGIIWDYLHRDSPDGCDHCPFCVVLPCLVKLQQLVLEIGNEAWKLRGRSEPNGAAPRRSGWNVGGEEISRVAIDPNHGPVSRHLRGPCLMSSHALNNTGKNLKAQGQVDPTDNKLIIAVPGSKFKIRNVSLSRICILGCVQEEERGFHQHISLNLGSEDEGRTNCAREGNLRLSFKGIKEISNHLELIKPNPRDDKDKQRKDAKFASTVFGTDLDLVGGYTSNESFMGLSDVKHCGKMRALEKLMFTWISQGDKILLFSYSVRMLDILEKFLIRKGYCFSRLDGSTPTGLRQSLVDDFNSSPSKQVFLISTRAGGLGLNLVSANRVVIFDPNWNPAQDLQAQDRSFRFGQKRHVVVFRLLAAGSLEELVYSRQVYKQQLSNIAVSGKFERRYFEGVQDCKEFQGELFGICNLFRDLSDKLFTNEIIELHKKQGHEDGDHHKVKKDSTSDGMYFLPSQEVQEPCSTASETNKPKDLVRGRTIKPVIQDLGIVYAHRNEDIVNSGPATQGKKDPNMPQNDALRQPSDSVMGRRKRNDKGGQKNASSEMRKKNQFILLANFMGMREVEFSKWLLSASAAEREEVLRDYKRRKENT